MLQVLDGISTKAISVGSHKMRFGANLIKTFFIVPRLFEEKRRDTVFGFPWRVVPNF